MGQSLLRVSVLVSLLGAAIVALPLHAEVRSGESVEVHPGQTVDGNLYGAAGTIAIGGDVFGDVVVGGGTVVVSGHVHGDVLAVGGTVLVTGAVDGDIRAVGGDVSVMGLTAGDAVLAGGTVKLAGRVGGDALVGGGEATVRAPIGHSLFVAGAETRLSAPVGRDVVVAADHLILDDGASVGGNVDYTGNTFDKSPGAIVNGTVTHTPAESQARMIVRVGVVGWLQGLIGLWLFGALWMSLFRGFAQRSMDTLRDHPGLSFGVGSGVLFGAPLVLGLAFVVGVVTGGWWISVFGSAIYAMAIAITFPLVAGLIGRRTIMVPLRVRSELVPMLLVLLVQSLLTLVPVVGPVLNLAIVLFGLGAIAVTLLPTMKKARLPAGGPASGTPVSAPA